MTPLDLLRLIHNLIRRGTVDSVDVAAGTVVIMWPSGVRSRPMEWALTSAAFYAEPVVGDQATVFSQGGDSANAIAFVGVASTDADRGSKSEAARADLVGDELSAIRDAHNMHIHGSPQAPSGNLLTTPPSSTPTGAPLDFQYTPGSVAANFVKVD